MLPYIDAPFAYAASTLGASTDEIKLIFSFLLSYPLAALLKRIPENKPSYKNIYIISVSLFYLLGLFDLWGGVRTILISSIGAYTIAYAIDGPFMPWIGFAFLMGHLSLNHINRKLVNDPSAVDITGAQMVLVMKLTAFCWNVHDGRLPEEELGDDFQKQRALKSLPDLLEYAAYVLFFPSLFAGPAFDYTEYRAYIETTMFQVPPGTDPSKAPPTRKKRRIPRSATPAMFKLVKGLLWLVAFLRLSAWYYPEILLGDRLLGYNILRRIWTMHMVGFTVRTKYYAVWGLTEGACIMSGIGFNGFSPESGQINWDKLQNVDPVGVELAQNSRAYLGNWNINTNNWLRNYMYLRVTPKGKKPGFRASMATFVTSAFWHGFESGYYMAFMLAALIQTVAKNARRLLRPFFMAPDGKTAGNSKIYYDVFSWTITQLAFSFTVAPFILLSFSSTITIWARVYFYCVIGVAASLAFLASPGKPWLRKQLAARNKPKSTVAIDGEPKTQHTANASASGSPLQRSESHEYFKGATLGMPDDPGQDLDEIMESLKEEVRLRRDRGQSIGQGLTEAVQAKLREVEAEKLKREKAS
ncbi:MAG: lysophospholipid acyltransferase [Chrysothrix sp. TS-e1954]|nr:MAG: lysophospholipid acyltransferase [Chrysothrix sp. TS-e1954]